MSLTTGYSGPLGDLALYFDTSFPGSQTTGYKLANGTDVGAVLTAISNGSANANVTNYKISTGADLNTLFAANGTAFASYSGSAGDTGAVLNGTRTIGFRTALGSISPTTFKGNTILEFMTQQTYVSGSITAQSDIFQMSCASDPGSAAFTSIQVGSNPVRLASAATYNFAGGNATWTWNGASDFFGSSGAYTAKIHP